MSKAFTSNTSAKASPKVSSVANLNSTPLSGQMRNPTAFPQPRLQVGPSNDRFEQEADRVADSVMDMGTLSVAGRTGGVHRKAKGFQGLQASIQRVGEVGNPKGDEQELEARGILQAEFMDGGGRMRSISRIGKADRNTGVDIPPLFVAQRECAACNTGKKENEVLQRRSVGEGFAAGPEVSSNVESMKSGGNPLPRSTRDFLEPRFGADLGHVRVHTDSRAANTADAIQAKAFTSGNHIAFNRGQFQPGTGDGMRLLAHEVTHTFQQGAVRRDIIRRKTQSKPVRQPALSENTIRSALRWYRIRANKPSDVSGLAWELGKVSGLWGLVRRLRGKSDVNRDFVLLVAGTQKFLQAQGFPLVIDGKLGENTRLAGKVHTKGDKNFLNRLGFVKKAAGLSLDHMLPAIQKKLNESLIRLLAGLAFGLLAAGLLLGTTTAIGAAIGFLLGGVGAAPGAVIGFKVGLFLLKWLGIGFLIAFLADRVKVIGGRVGRALKLAWNSGGNKKLLDTAGRGLALAVAETLQVAFEIMVALGIARGAKRFTGPLRRSRFAKWVGRNKLFRWLKFTAVKNPQRKHQQFLRENAGNIRQPAKGRIGTNPRKLGEIDLLKQQIASRISSKSAIRKRFGFAVNTGRGMVAKLNCAFCTLAGARKTRISSSDMARILKEREGPIRPELFDRLVIRAGYRNAKKKRVATVEEAMGFMAHQKPGTRFAIVFQRKNWSTINFSGQRQRVSKSGERFIQPEAEFIYDSHVIYGKHGFLGPFTRDFQKFLALPSFTGLGTQNVRGGSIVVYILK